MLIGWFYEDKKATTIADTKYAMGFLDNLVGSGVGEIVKSVSDTVDKFIETPDEERDFEKFQIQVQTEINKIEAGSRNFFIAGWRPSVGWICTIAFGWHFVGQPLLIFLINIGAMMFGVDPASVSAYMAVISSFQFDMATLLYVLGGLLGLGGLRTYEKHKGVSK